MRDVQKVSLVFRRTGEQFEIYRDVSSGHYFCPICGSVLSTEAPYEPDGLSSHNICPSCWFEYGYDDQTSETFPGYMKCWENWRNKWLQEEAHAPWCYDQLKNIGIHLSPPNKKQESK